LEIVYLCAEEAVSRGEQVRWKAKTIEEEQLQHTTRTTQVLRMGAGKSLPKEDMDELLRATHFKKQELQRWYKKFMSDYPSGQMNLKEFMVLFSKIYKTKKAKQLAEHIFRAFDTTGDNKISFKELMVNLSITSRGTKREKLEWAFRVYDFDGSGYITVDEVHQIMLATQTVKKPEEGITPLDAEKVMKMFLVMDENSDGQLTLDEFIAGVQKYPWFIDMLNGTMSNEEAKTVV